MKIKNVGNNRGNDEWKKLNRPSRPVEGKVGTWEAKNIPDTRMDRDVLPPLGIRKGRPSKGEMEKITENRQRMIMDVFAKATGPITPAEVAFRVGHPRSDTWVGLTVRQLFVAGKIKKHGKIKYILG